MSAVPKTFPLVAEIDPWEFQSEFNGMRVTIRFEVSIFNQCEKLRSIYVMIREDRRRGTDENQAIARLHWEGKSAAHEVSGFLTAENTPLLRARLLKTPLRRALQHASLHA
jgi:hypothetical protein